MAMCALRSTHPCVSIQNRRHDRITITIGTAQHLPTELSRFATLPIDPAAPLSHAETDYRRRRVLGAAVQVVAARGATRMIMVTVLGVERLMRTLGVHAHRAGPPRIDGKLTLALWLELDDQTRSALNLPSLAAAGTRH